MHESAATDAPGLLGTADAAARLGVKPQTLYAYVSRGLLTRTVAIDGRSSLFDPAELDALKLGRGRSDDGELRTLIATAITRVDDQGLLVRGRSIVDLVADGLGFLDVADLLWQSSDEPWPTPEPTIVTEVPGLDGLRSLVALASSSDPLRHDLSARSVRSAGRRMIMAMAHGLPTRPQHSAGTSDHDRGSGHRARGDVAASLWHRLTARPGTDAERRALDVALALLVDHGMASSTFAARIAASVRADPYSVVGAGLGVLGGTLHGAASAGVHELVAAAARLDDAAVAVGERLRDAEHPPGFGHTVYRVQDPRYGALMAAIIEAWRDDPRLVHVYRVRDVVAERRNALPNVDLALGALTWLADMNPDAGEIIFAISRTTGWLAHAVEEYQEPALRFRPRARYTGPAAPSGSSRGGS